MQKTLEYTCKSEESLFKEDPPCLGGGGGGAGRSAFESEFYRHLGDGGGGLRLGAI